MAAKMPLVKNFRGFNNVMDPLNLGLDWFVQAENIDIDDAWAIEKRSGYVQMIAGDFPDAYSTFDYQRMYVVKDGALCAMASESSAVQLQAGLDDATMFWAEANGDVFFNNGTDRGVIAADNSIIPLAWTQPTAPTLAAVTGTLPAGQYQVKVAFQLADGRVTGCSEAAVLETTGGHALQITSIPHASGCSTRVYIAPAGESTFGLASRNAGAAMVWNSSPDNLGKEPQFDVARPIPDGCGPLAVWRTRLYAAQHFPQADQSAVWPSLPFAFHAFPLGEAGFLVPGEVRMLAPHDSGLIVGTERAVHFYDGKTLTQLADYGVPTGQHWSMDDDKTIVFLSLRGPCRAVPFSNLTERHVSVAVGSNAGGTIVRAGGQRAYLVAFQQGGSAFNPH